MDRQRREPIDREPLMYRYSLVFLAILTAGCSTTQPQRKAVGDVSPIVLETEEALVGGPLTTEHWQEAFDRNEELLRECALSEPRALGEMTLRMMVDKSGDVRMTSSAPIDSGVYTAEIFGCIADATRDWTFPESGADSEIIVRLKFSRLNSLDDRGKNWGILGRVADASGHVLAIDGRHVRPDRLCEAQGDRGLACGDISLEFYRSSFDSSRDFILTAARDKNIASDPKSIEKAVRRPIVCEIDGQPISCYLFEQPDSSRRSILFGRAEGSEFEGAFCEVPKRATNCLGLLDYEILE